MLKIWPKIIGGQIDIPILNESLGPLRWRQPTALELVGMRAPGPTLENDVWRRGPSQVLSELRRAGELDQHTAEIEKEKLGSGAQGSGLLALGLRHNDEILAPVLSVSLRYS